MVGDLSKNLASRTLHRQQRMDCAESPEDQFLPSEILEKILSYVWLSPMDLDERRSVFAAVCLVSKVFIAVFTRILVRDAFILSPNYFHFYARLFHGQSLVFKIENASSSSTTVLSDICLSFTRQFYTSTRVAQPRRRFAKPRDNLRNKYMRDLLATFRSIPFLPNMRSLAVAYCPDEDKKQKPLHGTHTRGVRVPRQDPKFTTFTVPVARLDLEYSITSSTPEWLLDELGISGKRDSRNAKHRLPSPCAGPDLEHVSFPDDDVSPLGAFLRASPHLQLAVDKGVQIRVRILAASGGLSPGCAIVHGAIEPSTYVPGRLSGHSQPPLLIGGASTTVVHGTALGFLFEEPKKGRNKHAMEESSVLNTWRRVHVFMPRR